MALCSWKRGEDAQDESDGRSECSDGPAEVPSIAVPSVAVDAEDARAAAVCERVRIPLVLAAAGSSWPSAAAGVEAAADAEPEVPV